MRFRVIKTTGRSGAAVEAETGSRRSRPAAPVNVDLIELILPGEAESTTDLLMASGITVTVEGDAGSIGAALAPER